MVPNLFILGAAKSGTSSLHDYMAQHPSIYMSKVKEPHFFNLDENYNKGYDYYINQYFNINNSYRIIGESTPAYLRRYDKVIPRLCDFVQKYDNKSVYFIIIL